MLQPSADDLTRYGIDGGTPTKLSEIGRILITASKAFRMGLTQSVILPAMRDDPHGAFQNMANLKGTVAMLGQMLDQVVKDLAEDKDPVCSSKTLADNLVITVHGDTPKDPMNNNGWPDGTPNNANWIYVMGNGYVKTGWFGGVRAESARQRHERGSRRRRGLRRGEGRHEARPGVLHGPQHRGHREHQPAPVARGRRSPRRRPPPPTHPSIDSVSRAAGFARTARRPVSAKGR